MNLADFTPAFAAVTCWEFSAAYYIIWKCISPQAVNQSFALLAFFLGAMNYFDLMLLDTRNRHADLIWYYLHYFSIYGIFIAWINFLPLLIRCPLPKSWSERRIGLLFALISVLQFSHKVLHIAPSNAPTDDFNAYVCGPYYALYAGLPIAAGFVSFAWAIVVISKQTLETRQLEEKEGMLWARRRDVLLILWGAAAVVIPGAFELYQQVIVPSQHFSINPRALGTVLFCIFTAWTLWQVIERSKERLELSQRARNGAYSNSAARLQATYDLRHQIQNRLDAVETPLRDSLRDFTESNENARQQARIGGALNEVRDLHHSLDVLLNVARLASGEPAPLGQPRAVDVAALVQGECEKRRQWETERRASRFAEETPQWEFLCDVQMDAPDIAISADDLAHVLSVLLDNAVKYSPQGGNVTVRLWNERRELRICVTDEGIGIPVDELEKLGTRPFLRGDRRPQELGGTGLGLFLARRLVEAQGGRFWAESEIGKGSAFHIALPM